MDAILKWSAVVVGIALGVSANAQTPPTAGTLLQGIEQQNKSSPPGPNQIPEATPAQKEMPPSTGATVQVQGFRFDGNTLISDEALHEAVSQWIGKALDFNQLDRVAQIVAETYRNAGWVVRTYLPKQDVTAGVVTIRVIEAKFGEAEIEGEVPKRLKPDVAVAIVRGAQTPGAPLNADKLEHAVLLVEELPGIAPSASLKAGEQEGQTDVLLKLREGPLFSGDVGADNTGARSTGSGQLTGNLAVNDPLGTGDQALVNLIHSSGIDYGRLGYSVPLGRSGLRFSAYASLLDYSLVGSDFSALDAHGRSSNYGLDLRYPWMLTSGTRVYLGISPGFRYFDNQANGATTSHYGITDVGVDVVASHFDRLMGGGLTSGALTFTHGNADLNGSSNQAADAATTQTAGGFNKVEYSVTRYQTLTKTLNLTATLKGQTADKNLDSAEKFYLGGIGGVRAYPTNEAGGSSGQIIALDLRQRLASSLVASAFFDWGHVTINEHNNFPGAERLNGYSLKGAGLGLTWSSAGGITLAADWAHRIGNNPNTTADGKDQDGSLDKNRIWLVLRVPFGFDIPAHPFTEPASRALSASANTVADNKPTAKKTAVDPAKLVK